MPTFDTPGPITVTLDLGVAGDLRIIAGDRTDATVEIRPTDETDASDVQAATQVRADYANGVLQVTGPKARPFDFSRKTRSVDVSIAVPTGSRVTGELQLGEVHCAGTLGETRIKTGAGHLTVENTAALHLDTGAGHVTADQVAGDAEIHTGTGNVRVGHVGGTALVKSSNGTVDLAGAGGEARVRTSNGDIAVGDAGAGVDAKTAVGAVRVGRAVRGEVTLATGAGDVEVGIAEGTAAWLEVKTGFGRVRNLMESAAQPTATDETVEVRAKTSYGDITISRS